MEEQMNEDDLYIRQFLDGKERGFEMLVRKYQNRALNIVYSLIGKDRESEDIIQEVFLRVYRNLRFFKRKCHFSTWLYRIVVNITYDFLRRRQRTVNKEDKFNGNIASGQNPRDLLLRREKERMVQAALNKVPVKFRVPLVFKDVEGLSYMEIAGILRCRIGTIESRIYRARKYLRKELLKSGGVPA